MSINQSKSSRKARVKAVTAGSLIGAYVVVVVV